jgi:sugar lactone lactonase YvrE
MKPTYSSRSTLVVLTLALINLVGLSATAFAAQALWVADAFEGTVVEFLSTQVAAGGNQTPHLTNASASLSVPAGIAFDTKGDLWVDDQGAPSLNEFTHKELTKLSTDDDPIPTTRFAPLPALLPEFAVFSTTGNLWIADAFHTLNHVIEFKASSLKLGFPPNRSADVILGNAQFNGPIGVIFHAGDLWVSSSGSDTNQVFKIFKYLPSGLNAKGVPAVILTPDVGNSLDGPIGMAFDSKGNLWVANGFANTVVEFAAKSIKTTGAPTPVVTIGSNGGSLDSPAGLAFDSSGDLAVSNRGNNTIAFFHKSLLAASGSPTPSALLQSSALSSPFQIVFGPSIN